MSDVDQDDGEVLVRAAVLQEAVLQLDRGVADRAGVGDDPE